MGLSSLPRASPRILLIALVALAWALRVAGLDGESLWFDTAHSAAVALNPTLPAVVQAAAGDLQAPLYFVLLHYWLQLGVGDFWLRLPTAIAGTLIVPLTYALGARLFSQRAGAIAALFCALTTYQVYYSRYARTYILVALLIVLAAYTLHRALADRRSPLWAAYAVSVALALYCQQYAVFALPPLFAFGAWSCARSGRHSWLPFLLASGGAVAAYLPWLAISFVQLSHVRAGADAWMEPVGAGSLKTVYDWLWFKTRAEYGPGVDPLLRGARYLFMGLMVVSLWRGRRSSQVWFTAAMAGAPVAGALVFSLAVTVVWDARYLVVVSPFFGLLLGLAVSEAAVLLPIRRGRAVHASSSEPALAAPAAAMLSPSRQVGAVGTELAPPAPAWPPNSGPGDPTYEPGVSPFRLRQWATPALVALLVAMSAPPLGSLFADQAFAAPDIKGGVRWVYERYRDGDLILHVNYQSYLPALWYEHTEAAPPDVTSYAVPCVWESLPDTWCSASPRREGYVDLNLASFDAAVHGERRVWLLLLYNHNWEGEEAKASSLAQELAAARFKIAGSARFTGVLVYELERTEGG